MKKAFRHRIISFVLLFVWMAIIFMLSAQRAEQSSELSGGFVTAVISAVYPDYDELPAEKQENINHTVTLLVRKTAHFSEYFVLGALAFWVSVTFTKYKMLWRSAAAFAVCVLYAVSDEVHQHFVPGRACRFTDVLIDGGGSLLAIFILTLIFIKSNKIRDRLGE